MSGIFALIFELSLLGVRDARKCWDQNIFCRAVRKGHLNLFPAISDPVSPFALTLPQHAHPSVGWAVSFRVAVTTTSTTLLSTYHFHRSQKLNPCDAEGIFGLAVTWDVGGSAMDSAENLPLWDVVRHFWVLCLCVNHRLIKLYFKQY